MKDTIIELDDGFKISLKAMLIQDMKPYLSDDAFEALWNNMESYTEKYIVNLSKMLIKISYTTNMSDEDLPF